jgi:hypothetical protein
MRRLVLGVLVVSMFPPAARAQAAGGAVEQALGVVLRSGCAEGVAALAALADDAGVSAEDRAVARRIVGLCQGVVAERPLADGVDRSGRGKLVFGGTLYGIWAGIAFDIIADIDDGRALVVPPLLGGVAGVTLSLLGTRHGEITTAQAWSTLTGFDYGTYSGLLWGAAANSDDENVVVGSALGTGLAGGIAAIMFSRDRHLLQGDIELVRSGGLWGFASGALLAAMVMPEEGQVAFTMMGLGMDGGLLAGLGLAQVFDIPRNRMLFIDTGALSGGLLGFAAAFLAIGPPDGEREGRILASSALAGLYAGLAASVYLTRNMLPDRQDARGGLPALVSRDPDGHWRLGRLALLPVVTSDGSHTRVTGVIAPLLGGAW